MSSPLASAIANLSSAGIREAAQRRRSIGLGRAAQVAQYLPGGRMSSPRCYLAKPTLTVGLAVQRDTFGRIRIANGTPRACRRLRTGWPRNSSWHPGDGWTSHTREPGGSGAISKYLNAVWGGVQQVEFAAQTWTRHANTERQIQELVPVILPPGMARMARDQFFLVASSGRRLGAHLCTNCKVSRIVVRIQRHQKSNSFQVYFHS